MYEEEEALRDEVKAGLLEEGCTQARFSEQNNRKPTGQINDMRSQLSSYYTRETLKSRWEEQADVVRRSSVYQPPFNSKTLINRKRLSNRDGEMWLGQFSKVWSKFVWYFCNRAVLCIEVVCKYDLSINVINHPALSNWKTTILNIAVYLLEHARDVWGPEDVWQLFLPQCASHYAQSVSLMLPVSRWGTRQIDNISHS